MTTRLTVTVTDRTAALLEEAAATTGDSRTDVLNRAVQLYAKLTAHVAQGGTVLLRTPGLLRELMGGQEAGGV